MIDTPQLIKSIAGIPSIAAAAFLTTALPALADGGSPFEGVQANSLYVTGGLILMCIPGEWLGMCHDAWLASTSWLLSTYRSRHMVSS
jgi:hypothetical protein